MQDAEKPCERSQPEQKGPHPTQPGGGKIENGTKTERAKMKANDPKKRGEEGKENRYV